MIKYDLLREQLIYEGTLCEENFFHPGQLSEEHILQTHTMDYWMDLKFLTLPAKAIRKIGFPMSSALVTRGQHIAMGTLQCARHALDFGISMNTAGGTHHAFANRGEGFCVLNDFAIAANILLSEQTVDRILIVDLDVHQGNGTAKIFQHDQRVFTFSMHGEKNYPVRKEKSDLDIELPDGITDEPYLGILEQHLESLLEKVKPDLVFYLSGVDVLATDKLGRLGLTRKGCKARDHLVFTLCKEAAVPVAVSMGGGYSERLTDLIEAHANTFRVAQELYF